MPVERKGELGCSARSAYSEPAAHATDASKTDAAPAQLNADIPSGDQGANNTAVPKKPRMSPAATIQEGRLPPGLSQSRSTINRGSVAIKSAVIPDDNDCSAHTTPPLPRRRSKTPIRRAGGQC